MGYSIKLVGDDGEPVSVMLHQEGSVFAIDGTTDAVIDITYNYAKYFKEEINERDGIRWLYGKHAHECKDVLEAAVEKLGTLRSADYWEQTPGNAGDVLYVLLKWSRQYPYAIFMGD